MNEPMRVTAIMSEPVIYSGDGMHLDGPLAYGHYRLLDDRTRKRMTPISAPWALDFRLPLARWYSGDPEPTAHERIADTKTGLIWGWRCSAAHAEWARHDAHYVRRPTAAAEMARYTDSPSVSVSAGRYKAQNKRLPSVFAREVVWYAVGDIDGVRRLLEAVPSIGKLGGHGLGTVQRWVVEPAPNDWSVTGCDGCLTRRMPDGYCCGDGRHRRSVGGIRAPYHHSSRQIACIEPDFMELRPDGSD